MIRTYTVAGFNNEVLTSVEGVYVDRKTAESELADLKTQEIEEDDFYYDIIITEVPERDVEKNNLR